MQIFISDIVFPLKSFNTQYGSTIDYFAVMFTEDLAIYVPRATGGMLFGGVVISLLV